jgi:hypothetical protein
MLAAYSGATRLILAVAALSAFAQPAAASAATCESLMSDLNTWFVKQPQGQGTYQVLTRITVLRSDGRYAGYVEGPSSGTTASYAGVLTYHPSSAPKFGLPFPAYLQDPATPAGTTRGLSAYFSDRRYTTCTGTCLIAPEFPFNARATDRQGVQIQLQDSFNIVSRTSVPAGTVTFTLYSWGNAQYTMSGNQCTVNGDGKGGIVYGFLSTGSGDTELIALSLNESFAPPVRLQ